MRDNYCMYSLMHKYKYVSYSDFDELFFPSQIETENLTSLLDRMDRPERGSFTFRPKYHTVPQNDTPHWEELNGTNFEAIVRRFIPMYYHKNISTMVSYFIVNKFCSLYFLRPEAS